jgi:hypothetical protein
MVVLGRCSQAVLRQAQDHRSRHQFVCDLSGYLVYISDPLPENTTTRTPCTKPALANSLTDDDAIGDKGYIGTTSNCAAAPSASSKPSATRSPPNPKETRPDQVAGNFQSRAEANRFKIRTVLSLRRTLLRDGAGLGTKVVGHRRHGYPVASAPRRNRPGVGVQTSHGCRLSSGSLLIFCVAGQVGVGGPVSPASTAAAECDVARCVVITKTATA